MPKSRELEKRIPQGFKKLAQAAEAGKKGNYRKAITLLNELISETDAPPEAWLLLGRAFHALKDYSKAIAAFNDYARLRPKAGEAPLFLGRTYLSAGIPYKAIPFLRKAHEKSPGNSTIKALLGIAYMKAKHSQAAVELLEDAVKAAPEDKRIYRAYLNSLLLRGVRLCRLEEYDLGLQMLRFVLENGPDYGMSGNTFLMLEMGRAARELGNFKEALNHYSEALKLSKSEAGAGDRRIRWSRASVLMALGRNTEAMEEIEKIRAHDSDVPELPWNSELVDLFMIKSFLEAGEWRRVSDSCRDWLRSRSDTPLIHALYAEALRNMSNFKAAHNHLQRAIENSSGELDFWYSDILVSWEGKDFKSLKKALRAAKSLGGDENILRRFTILSQTQASDDVKKSISLLQEAIRTLGPEPELMYTLGESYLKAGLLDEAISWFKKTIALKENHEKAWLGQIASLEAIIAEEGEKTDKNHLDSLYKTYLEKWPSNSSIRRDRAMFLVKTFEYAEASKELEKLLIWEPGNPSLRRVLAYTYRKTGRYREAAVFLKALLKEKPRDVGILIEFSGCLERAGSLNYALAVLEKAKELFGGSDICLALGIVSYRAKDLERAFDYFREAASLAPGDPRPYEWMANIAKKNNEAGRKHYEKQAEMRKKA